ncbi:calcium-binding protein, partial [Virgifigura deserti]|uniref:calcium-binding protein n=1 Tax=Virgifigura deserti TaxID=2268457 RepID=UPI003CCBE049
MVTFGQVFAAGDVTAGEGLVALIDGVAVPLQVDVKATHPDGSVRHALLSVAAPALAAGAAVDVMLAKGAPAAAPAVDVAAILDSGYDVELVVDGEVVDVAALLAEALAAGTATSWLEGPLASEVRVAAPISDDGNLHATFDIRVQADGSVRTDVALAYDWAYSMGMDNLTYDVEIRDKGQTVVRYDDLEHHHHGTWHQEVWSDGAPGVNVVRDVPYLVQTAAVPGYDTSIAIDGAALDKELAKLANTDTGPMGSALVETAMPGTGGRFDIGPTTTWNARYLLSQDPRALEVMLANADAAGSIPWHFRDNATGEYIRVDDHPQLWIDERGVGGRYGDDQLPEAYNSRSAGGWIVDAPHQPALLYLPYLFTGSRHYLDELHAQTSFTIGWFGPHNRGEEEGIVDSNELRAKAWSLRTIGDTAYITPDDHALKDYFTQILDNNLTHFVEKYVTGGAMDAAGEVEGWIPALVKAGHTAGWQSDFMTIILSVLAQRGHEDAETMLDWMTNFVAGRFLNGENGFDPLQGAAYVLKVYDPETGEKYTTWEEVFQKTFPNGSPDGTSLHVTYAFGYGAIAKASLASLVSATGSPEAIEAYGFVVGETTRFWDKYDSDPTWLIAPQLADGSYLLHSDIHVGSGTLTGTDRNELLHGGDGADRLDGGGGIDLLYGGAGDDEIAGGAGNDYLFGNAGADVLTGGAGNDVLKGNAGADLFVYAAANSGHDVILDFTLGTDRLAVAGGLADPAALLAAATADADGNAVLQLDPDSSITLIGVNP